MKKVLVTGASGFIGSALTDRLFKRGYKVYGISRVFHIKDDNTTQWIALDLKNYHSLNKIFSTIKPDIIYHFASNVTGSRSIDVIRSTFENNLMTTVNLLTCATEHNCNKVILAGSMEEPLSYRTIPNSPYSMSKLASTLYAQMFNSIYELPVIVLRIFMVYGPGQRDQNKLIPYVINCFLNKKSPRLTSGMRKIDWIYIDDVINACIAVINFSSQNSSILDIGTGKLINIKKIVLKIQKIIGTNTNPEFNAIPDRKGEREMKANLKRTRAQIDWQPNIELEEGLKRTIEWYSNKKIL